MSDHDFRVISDGNESLASVTSSGHSSTLDVPIRFVMASEHVTGVRPVSGGVCIPKGLLHNVTSASVQSENSDEATAQVDVLNRWADGSVRWLLASTVNDPSAQDDTAVLRLRSIALAEMGTDNSAVMKLYRNGSRLILQTVDSFRQSQSDVELIPELMRADGTIARLKTSAIHPEIEGQIRSVYRIDSVLREDARISLQLRLELWPTAGVVQVHVRLRNSRRARHRDGLWDLGDPGSFHFQSLRVLVKQEANRSPVIRWKPDVDAAVRDAGSGPMKIVQYGSGGPAWDSSNHRTDQPDCVASPGCEATDPSGTMWGTRATPFVSMVSDDHCVTIVVPEFWQKFPASLRAEDSVVSIGLFPEEVVERYELQGGEQSTQSFWMSTCRPNAALSGVDAMVADVRMLPTAEWVQSCDVIDWFSSPESGATTKQYRSYIHDATTGTSSLAARRESIDEYGWRNYGDVPADHEQAHYVGTHTVVSHYNNQYDQVFGGILNLLVTGDDRWWDLCDPLARHVMDIDIYHTSEDRSAFNGGLFWHTDHYVDAHTATHRTYSRKNCGDNDGYGGGPANEHNYTTGLLHYYFLTGNPEAAESVRSLADWVIAMDDGSLTVFGLFDDGPTGLSTSTVSEDYQGPGRGAGNSINALLDAWLLTSEERYLTKAEELIRRVVHPEQDLDALNLLDSETHWSYTVCLASLGRYLGELERAGRRGPCYAYVRATLCHYGRWMAKNERPALSDPDGLEFVTVAWAAQDFRKANALRIAATCCDNVIERNRMCERADELNASAWRDFYEFGQEHLTARCLAILMTEGLREAYHRDRGGQVIPPADEDWLDPLKVSSEWTMFIPQKERVRQQLRSPGSAVRAIVCALNPGRWIRTAVALKRRF